MGCEMDDEVGQVKGKQKMEYRESKRVNGKGRTTGESGESYLLLIGKSLINSLIK